KRRAVARLLVAPIAAVLRMDHDVQAEAPRDLDRPVARSVVDEDDVVDGTRGNVGERLRECPLRVVRGHDDGDLSASAHGYTPRRVRITRRVRSRIERSSPKVQLFK